GGEIASMEGTTQDDPLAMAIYALAITPLIKRLKEQAPNASQEIKSYTTIRITINDAYDEITTWRKNVFLVPYGKIGRDFIDQITMHINDWNSGSENQHVSLKAVFVLLAVGLQKPNPKSKAKDHQDALSKRLALWKDGEIRSNHPDKAKVFAKLVLEGQINSALRFKYPEPQPAKLGSINDEMKNVGIQRRRCDDASGADHQCNPLDRDILALPARLGGLGLENPSHEAERQYVSSKRVTAPLVDQIVAQLLQLPDESHIKSAQQAVRKERVQEWEERAERSSVWLTALPLKEQGFNLNKREFRDAVKLRYDWPIDDIPSICVCGNTFTVDHAMICKRGGFVIMRHNELRDLEAELLNIVCSDVQVEPVLQDISGEQLNGGSNKAPDARLDIRARGFWESQQSAFFDVRVCHPNADSYKDLELRQVYKIHENEKKRLYARRVLEIEQGTFTPLVFTTTGGMAKECVRYHSRLAELVAIKKGEDYATTMSWISARTSFALLRSALTCLRDSRKTPGRFETTTFRPPKALMPDSRPHKEDKDNVYGDFPR
ncbi:Hypothetical predicted protein, partial [Paramuricea clavata]